MIEARKQLEQRNTASGGKPPADVGFDDPDPADLRGIPWGGDGPDPLEELWERS